jgi:hypothetical protein
MREIPLTLFKVCRNWPVSDIQLTSMMVHTSFLTTADFVLSSQTFVVAELTTMLRFVTLFARSLLTHVLFRSIEQGVATARLNERMLSLTHGPDITNGFAGIEVLPQVSI